ncbi:integrase catalytic domain-containing protein [Trichonephila clavipes]|nr:integrase catalytic domain-containing protein [Trichonephila clavipes]
MGIGRLSRKKSQMLVKQDIETASVLCDDFYMDDVLSGANALEVTKTLQHQLIDILKTAKMSLHKWCANTSELIPNTVKEYDFTSPEEIKTLGYCLEVKN